MEQLVCRHCGSIDDYRTEQKSNNQCAFCNGCGAFIKNIPHDVPRLYVGKYKGIPIKDIEDIQYLKWAHDTLSLNNRQKTALKDRIYDLQYLNR